MKSTPVSKYPYPPPFPARRLSGSERPDFIAYRLTGIELLILFLFSSFSFFLFSFLFFFFYTGAEGKAEVRSFLRRLFTFERFTEHVEYPTVLALGTELIHPPRRRGGGGIKRRIVDFLPTIDNTSITGCSCCNAI